MYIDEDSVINTVHFEEYSNLLICSICTGLLINPVMCSYCSCGFCNTCIKDWIGNNPKPCCPMGCDSNQFKLVECNRQYKMILEKLIVKCPKGCQVSLLDYPTHTKHNSSERPVIECWNCGTFVNITKANFKKTLHEVKLLEDNSHKNKSEITELINTITKLNKLSKEKDDEINRLRQDISKLFEDLETFKGFFQNESRKRNILEKLNQELNVENQIFVNYILNKENITNNLIENLNKFEKLKMNLTEEVDIDNTEGNNRPSHNILIKDLLVKEKDRRYEHSLESFTKSMKIYNIILKNYHINQFKLDLSKESIGEDGTKFITGFEFLNPTKILDLNSNGLGIKGMEDLAECHYFTKVSELNLHYNQLGPEGITIFTRCDFLYNLTCLDLSSNNIGDNGMLYLAQCQFLNNLTSLFLSFNKIGNDGIKHLKNCKNLSNVITLNLSMNNIEDEGITYLTECEFLTKLTGLDLKYNSISFDGILLLTKCVFFSNLKFLHLKNNKFGADSIKTSDKLEAFKKIKNTDISPSSCVIF